MGGILGIKLRFSGDDSMSMRGNMYIRADEQYITVNGLHEILQSSKSTC